MQKKITEENLDEFIIKEYENSKDYIISYENIYNIIITTQDEYASMKSNFSSLFLHYVIKKNIPIIEYDKLIDTIYNTIDNQNLGFMFARFFYTSNNITVKAYRKAKEMNIIAKYNEDYWYSKWDEIAHTFFDHKEGEELKLLPENKPYLFSLLKKLNKNNYHCLYESHFTFFPKILMNSLDDLKEIIIQQPLVINKFISLLSHMGYEINLEKKKEYIDLFKDNTDNFEKKFYSHVLKKNNSNSLKKIECDIGLCQFAPAIGYNIFFKNMNDRLLGFMEDKKFKEKNTRFIDLLDNISISLDIAFEEHIIDFDTNLINTKVSLHNNSLYLMIINTQLNQGNMFSCSKDVLNYLKDESNLILPENIKSFNDLYDINLLINYFNYSNMEKIIPQKNITSSKKKI